MVKLKGKADRDKLTQEVVREILDYSPETGIFVWKERGEHLFVATPKFSAPTLQNMWNIKWAGKEAFTADNGIGYKCGSIFRISVKAHQMAFLYMIGKIPDYIDHVNGIRSDNRWSNLEEVTPLQNGRNQKMPWTNTSGHIGVFKKKASGRYAAFITVMNKRINIGSYLTFEEACAARKEAEIKYGFHENHGRKIENES